jgi:hypothetical protein
MWGVSILGNEVLGTLHRADKSPKPLQISMVEYQKRAESFFKFLRLSHSVLDIINQVFFDCKFFLKEKEKISPKPPL